MAHCETVYSFVCCSWQICTHPGEPTLNPGVTLPLWTWGDSSSMEPWVTFPLWNLGWPFHCGIWCDLSTVEHIVTLPLWNLGWPFLYGIWGDPSNVESGWPIHCGTHKGFLRGHLPDVSLLCHSWLNIMAHNSYLGSQLWALREHM